MIQATQRPASASPVKAKSVFRKPFDAYEKVGPRSSLDGKRDGTPENEKKDLRKEKSKFRPYSSMKTAQAPTSTLKRLGTTAPPKQDEGPRIPAPPPRRKHSRRPSAVPSPQPSMRTGASASPTPTPQSYAASYAQPPAAPMYRAASPQPSYRAPSPAPLRPHSPLPSTYHDGSAYPQILPGSRQPSPNPYQQQQYISRTPSPAPSFGYQQEYRAYSPAPPDDDFDASSPPPPPPPAHRVVYQPSRAPSMAMYDEQDPYAHAGNRTPAPPSPSADTGSHMTPSPLRDAMNDVMSSLHDMSVYQDNELGLPPAEPSPARTPSNIWSPDEFELVRTRSQAQTQRAQSSLGFATDDRYDDGDDDQAPSIPSSRDGPPELGNYVHRMERQLRHTQSNASYASDRPPQPPLKGSQYKQPSRPTTASSHSSYDSGGRPLHSQQRHPQLKHRKSAYELGREALNRTFTTKTNVTNSTESSSATQSSTSTQLTSRSIMSGYSAGGFSATSAGSLARRKFGLGSQRGITHRPITLGDTRSMNDLTSSSRSMAASESVASGPSYHESHASGNQPVRTPTADWTKNPMESAGILGGLGAPKAKKSGFFKKMMESAKTTARTGAASARWPIGSV